MTIMTTQQDRNDHGQFTQLYDEPLAKTPRCVRFAQSVDDVLTTLPDKTSFIRDAVVEKLLKDGLLNDSKNITTE